MSFAQDYCGNTEEPLPPTSQKRSVAYCGNDPSRAIDYGNFMYIPNENSETLTIKMNLHIMQYAADDPRNYTIDDTAFLIDLVNARLPNMLARKDSMEECHFAVSGSPLTIDAKIKMQVGQIFFYVDSTAWKNNEGNQAINEDGSPKFWYNSNGDSFPVIVNDGLISHYCRIKYLNNNNLGDDALNVFFCERGSGNHSTGYRGWGPGYNSELQNHIVLTKAWSEKGTAWWKVDGRFLHEVGHCLGLHHSWLSTQERLFEYECNTGPGWQRNNHLMAYNNAQFYNSPLQDAHMRRHLLTTWRIKQLINTPLNNATYTFDSSYTIESDETITWIGNIIVDSGATLTIQGLLQMHKDKKIIVKRNAKLVVDGGVITSCDQWKGIVIEGDGATGSQANAGSVVFENEAIIEKAKTAVSMNPKHIPWPDRQSFWGGLVKAEKSTFRYCGRAVEFMKYGRGIIKDSSTFTNCTFEDMKYAITAWADNGVRVNQCKVTG